MAIGIHEEYSYSSSSSSSTTTNEQVMLPEIEARVSDNNHILIKVHCEKEKGVLANLYSKVESLNLVVVNTSVTPFGSFNLDITIIAEMEGEFNSTMKEVVTALRVALQADA
ncbi:hypothetical protein ACJIZ3_015000 [Penstemon smallii]|uniref:Plant bHLH transcription factor ACT-like domain-containing protein n=1 Tax=Penstemon smallii TaxID=265156 RepID=A0ABD3RL82_9LAMI